MKITRTWEITKFNHGNTELGLEVNKETGHWYLDSGHGSLDAFEDLTEEEATELVMCIKAAVKQRFKEEK